MEENKKAYARVILRVRAVLIDSVLLLALLVFGGVAFQGGYLSQASFSVLAMVVVGGVLVYEPLSVSLFGSTVGQYFSNVHVKDADTGRKIDFLRALLRYFIKFFFGWASFVTMRLTKKVQAFHDVLTNSVVLIRDLNDAEKSQYSLELDVPEVPGMPSRFRRSIVIFLYVFLLSVVEAFAFGIFISTDCLEKDGACSISEGFFSWVFQVAWLLLVALVVYIGWQGKLWGCRRRPSERASS